MEINKYQKWTKTTAIYPKKQGITYTALGLAGEAGEVCNKVKKIIRDDKGVVTELRRTQLEDELSDCFWYLVRLADELNLDCNKILKRNMQKLNSRKERGKIGGSGDLR